MDEKGEIIKQDMVQNTPTGVRDFINGSRGKEEVKAVMEATRNWDLMYDWLDEVVDEANRFRDDKKLRAYAGLVPSAMVCAESQIIGLARIGGWSKDRSWQVLRLKLDTMPS